MLNTIKTPIEKEMAHFDSYFKGQFTADVKLLHDALKYVCDGVGKTMRPILVMLVAKSLGGANERTYAAASAMEMLHTASLLHDDVIDESDKRRGRHSLNVVFNNNVAVLAGDYLFSLSLKNAAEAMDHRIIKEISKLGTALAAGEVLQVELQRSGEYNEENYLKVISYKTSSLFMCCAACGAYTAGADEEVVERYKKFGEYVGNCFQIKDDIFDYFSNDVGKPTGSDMREGKITIPAIYVLENSSNPLLEPIRAKIAASEILDENEIKALIDIAVNEGGIEYANSMIERFRNLALEQLPTDMPQDVRDALLAYIDFTIKRNK